MPKLWQTYLDNIHQAPEVEQDSYAAKKFWKKYEALVQQSKPSQKASLPQVKKAREIKKTYDDIFLKYWNGVSSTVTYDQEVSIEQKSNQTDSANALGCIIFISVILCIALIAVVLNIFESVFFFLFVASILFFSVFRINAEKENYYRDKVKRTTDYGKIHYSYHFHKDHLMFIKFDQDRNKTKLQIDYERIKSLKIVGKEIRFKSLYHKSLKNTIDSLSTKQHFCIPMEMPQNKKLTDFLREILIRNKA